MGLRRRVGRASKTKTRRFLVKPVFVVTVYVFAAAFLYHFHGISQADSSYIPAEASSMFETHPNEDSRDVRLYSYSALQKPVIQEDLPEHHSQPTTMSIQGKVTDKNGVAISSGNLQVKVSKSNSCTADVIYDKIFTSAISSGSFALTLGDDETLLWMDFNRNYWLCLFAGGELVSGPTKFRSTGGEVNRLGDANSGTYLDFENANVIVHGGNVGIGTTSPSQLLEVRKDQDASTRLKVTNAGGGASSSAIIQVTDDISGNFFNHYGASYTPTGSAQASGGELGNNGVGGLSITSAHNSGVLRFYTGGNANANERMRIDISGSIGIGTTSPVGQLNVVRNDATSHDIEQVIVLDHTTTGTPTNGIGSSFYFRAENSNNAVTAAAEIGGILTDVTAGSENGALIMRTRANGGPITERMRINATGTVKINGLSGSGNDYVCVDASGNLYRSDAVCA